MTTCPEDEKMRGKAESCKGCPNAQNCISNSVDPNISKIRENLRNFKLIISVMSIKGGVGKSTLTYNLGVSLSKLKIKTVVVDLDLSGSSIPRLSNTIDQLANNEKRYSPIVVTENLSVLSADHLNNLQVDSDLNHLVYSSSVKNNLMVQLLRDCNFDGFEVLLLDTPPNITDEHLALAQFFKVDYSLIITTPSQLSTSDIVRMLSFCKKTKIEVFGIIENQKRIVCSHCGTFISPTGDFSDNIIGICKNNGVKYIGGIPFSVNIAKNSDRGNFIEIPLLSSIACDFNTLMKNK